MDGITKFKLKGARPTTGAAAKQSKPAGNDIRKAMVEAAAQQIVRPRPTKNDWNRQ